MNTIIKSFKGLAVMSAVSLALAGCFPGGMGTRA